MNEWTIKKMNLMISNTKGSWNIVFHGFHSHRKLWHDVRYDWKMSSLINEWNNKWINEWMNKWMNKWINKRIIKQINLCIVCE